MNEHARAQATERYTQIIAGVRVRVYARARSTKSWIALYTRVRVLDRFACSVWCPLPTHILCVQASEWKLAKIYLIVGMAWNVLASGVATTTQWCTLHVY